MAKVLNPESFPQVRETAHLKVHSTLVLPTIEEQYGSGEDFFVNAPGLWVSPILSIFFECHNLRLKKAGDDLQACHSLSNEERKTAVAFDRFCTRREIEDPGPNEDAWVGLLVLASETSPLDITLGLPEMDEYTMYLGMIARLIKRQFNGKPGFLLVDGRANRFFINEYPPNFEVVLLARYQRELLRWEITIGDMRDHRQPPVGDMIILPGVVAS